MGHSAERDAPDREPLGAPCRYCGSGDTWVEWRLEAKPVGSFSLAGAQMKFSANHWPYAVCDGCGHVSRGQRAYVTPPAEHRAFHCDRCRQPAMNIDANGLCRSCRLTPPAEPGADRG